MQREGEKLAGSLLAGRYYGGKCTEEIVWNR